jgi:hypothetical protein
MPIDECFFNSTKSDSACFIDSVGDTIATQGAPMSTDFSSYRFQTKFGLSQTPGTAPSGVVPTQGQPAFSEQDKSQPKEEPDKLVKASEAEAAQHFPDRFTQFAYLNNSSIKIPSKWEFYWSELRTNMRTTMKQGDEQYAEALRRDKHTRLKALGMMAATGIGLTIFRRLRRTGAFILLMAILGKPIMVATQAFPKMSDAYEEVKKGNPTKGKEEFRNALDESFYTIFKDFFKPVSYGVMLAYILELPFAFRNEGAGIRHHIMRKVADVLRVKRNAKPIVWMYEKMKPYVHWGDRISNKIRKAVPILDWIEEPKHIRFSHLPSQAKTQLKQVRERYAPKLL